METFVRDDSEDIYFGADPEPYLFEPEYTENELLERERKESVSEQKGGGQPIRIWCKCGACQPMPTEKEDKWTTKPVSQGEGLPTPESGLSIWRVRKEMGVTRLHSLQQIDLPA
ncbi:hypothetical protein Q8A67_010866 [Cirrhinus molitorella]|uniref:Uncharacterized protein n=1 Tax=Cirrhinus molitorella TaxID=172907 RepID=A0AA88TQR1_9TELE|nr:hypothetical protein Q8A67_010866 [Cirrhinus molitorella]